MVCQALKGGYFTAWIGLDKGGGVIRDSPVKPRSVAAWTAEIVIGKP